MTMPSLDVRASCPAARSVGPGFEDDFGAVVGFVAEHLVGGWGLVDGEGVGDDEGGVDFAFRDAVEKRGHVAHHVGLAGLHGEALVDVGAHGDLVDEAAVDAGDGDGATFFAGENGLAQSGRAVEGEAERLLYLVVRGEGTVTGGLHADGIHAGIGALVAGHVPQSILNAVDFVEVEDFGAAGFERGRGAQGRYRWQ